MLFGAARLAVYNRPIISYKEISTRTFRHAWHHYLAEISHRKAVLFVERLRYGSTTLDVGS